MIGMMVFVSMVIMKRMKVVECTVMMIMIKVNRVMERPIMRFPMGVHVNLLSLRMMINRFLRMEARDFPIAAFHDVRRNNEVSVCRLPLRILLGKPIPVHQWQFLSDVDRTLPVMEFCRDLSFLMRLPFNNCQSGDQSNVEEEKDEKEMCHDATHHGGGEVFHRCEINPELHQRVESNEKG